MLGGDTTAAKDRLCISVTVLGTCGAGQSLKRSGARPGDLVCVTGTLGDSAAGLKLGLRDSPIVAGAMKHLIQRKLWWTAITCRCHG